MKIMVFLLLFLCCSGLSMAQGNYLEEMKEYRENYVIKHEVVEGTDKNFFRFYPISAKYKVTASVEKIKDTAGFVMKTSGTKDKRFFHYAKLKFKIHGKPQELTLYQSEQLMQDSTYKNYLFLPFTDNTSGNKSYGGGRYLDLEMKDIQNGQLVIDFNKAYNPYCAYSRGYNCPIPPRENHLPISVPAGEKQYKGPIKNRK